MFRLFGRKRSPVEGESSNDNQEANQEDGFVFVGQPDGVYPPLHTLAGAKAFELPYGVQPPGFSSDSSSQGFENSCDMSTQSLIRGVPFKFGSDVRIEGNTTIPELNGVSSLVEKINNFDWDEYEYNFKLEKNLLEEYATKLVESQQEEISS